MIDPRPICEVCGNYYLSVGVKSTCCSEICKKQLKNVRYSLHWDAKIEKSKVLEGVSGVLKCNECGYLTTGDLSGHLTRYHKMSYQAYYKKYGVKVDAILQPKTRKKLSASSSGNNNVWFNHRGKFSPFSKKNKNATPESIKAAHKKARATTKINCNDRTELSYYTSRGLSIDDAKISLSERQRTFSLEKCILKYGEEIGKKRWQDRQDKWHRSFKKE